MHTVLTDKDNTNKMLVSDQQFKEVKNTKKIARTRMNAIVLKDMKVRVEPTENIETSMLVTSVACHIQNMIFCMSYSEAVKSEKGDGRMCVDINECSGPGVHGQAQICGSTCQEASESAQFVHGALKRISFWF